MSTTHANMPGWRRTLRRKITGMDRGVTWPGVMIVVPEKAPVAALVGVRRVIVDCLAGCTSSVSVAVVVPAANVSLPRGLLLSSSTIRAAAAAALRVAAVPNPPQEPTNPPLGRCDPAAYHAILVSWSKTPPLLVTRNPSTHNIINLDAGIRNLLILISYRSHSVAAMASGGSTGSGT